MCCECQGIGAQVCIECYMTMKNSYYDLKSSYYLLEQKYHRILKDWQDKTNKLERLEESQGYPAEWYLSAEELKWLQEFVEKVQRNQARMHQNGELEDKD